jgi:hypothetical protein
MQDRSRRRTSGPAKPEGLDAELVELPVAAAAAAARGGTSGPCTTGAQRRRCRAALCSMIARTTPAVSSGRSVSGSPFIASTKEYISFSTMSVTSPMPRTNSAVGSTIGVRRLR